VNPQVTYHSWWPASVLLPRVEGERQQILHTCRAFATDAGLFVYRIRPADGITPDWFSPIDYRLTVKPINGLPGYAADVFTEAGLVVVTQTGGCGCGNPVKGWRPEFSKVVAAWPMSS
jgi:hypothetical protein